MTKIEPLNDRILVRRVDHGTDRTKGGLYIPDVARERPQEGEVVAIGLGKMLENGTRLPPALAVGDRVIFGKYAGSEITVETESTGEPFVLMREDEVLARVVTLPAEVKKGAGAA